MSGRAFTQEFLAAFYAFCQQMPAPLTRSQVAEARGLGQDTAANLLKKAARYGHVRRTGGGAAARWMSPTVYADWIARKDAARRALAVARSQRWQRKEEARLRAERARELETWAERMPVKRWSFVWLPVQKPPGPPSVFHLGAFL